MALSLTSLTIDTTKLERALAWLNSGEGSQNVDFLSRHGLTGWWLAQLNAGGVSDEIPPTIHEKLVNERRAGTVLYLTQGRAISEISASFERLGIVHAFFKGTAVREEAYSSPSLRTACDVDLLVSPFVRHAAMDCLIGLGFELPNHADLGGHEVTLTRGPVDIDLHWDILRPGRTRHPLVDSMLAQRVRGPTLWRLCDADMVFMMLVHPAITKYVCTPHMGLNRALDFVLFTRARTIDWADVKERLDGAGLATAAWCTLRWIELLAPPDLRTPPAYLQALAPGNVRKDYLNWWLIADFPGRLLNRADWLIRAAFTLPMHDRPSDALRAIRTRVVSRNESIAFPVARTP